MILTDIKINSITASRLVEYVLERVREKRNSYVCFANVHMIMEAHDSQKYKQAVNSADFVVPDGMPLVWLMRMKGQKNQERVYGPTLMLHILETAAQEKIPVGFYGSKPDVLKVLVEKMYERFKGLEVTYSFSPSFTEDLDEQELAIEQIKKSGTRILFIGLGCPKQEFWMAKYYNKLNVVMLGVGAAFDFHAGAKPQAPTWIQQLGFEWFFRLLTEPRRLWKRYRYHNTRFIFLVILDFLRLLK